MEKIKVDKLINTCMACPSQWEGLTDKNEPIYIRFRWDELTVQLGIKDGNISNAVRGQVIFSKHSVTGKKYCGFLSFANLKNLTKEVLILPFEETR